ncbi:MAG: 23S rRNA (guanosine(2251)-2'-O)-methyltransferase RlmB, partial [Gammaproteobacteria bacterium]|nr:23S rRNA (guanosine(2251)-2'-O)-methyltransferase RlmB [Gammaproteobacteria bacterium]
MSKPLTIYGLHAVRHALTRNPDQVLELWLADGQRGAQLQVLETAAEAAGVTVQRADSGRLARLAGSDDHQGAV